MSRAESGNKSSKDAGKRNQVAFPPRSDCKYAEFTSVCQTTPCKAPYNTTMGGVMQINRRGIQSIHVPNHFSISTLYAISYKPCNPSTLHQANHHRAISQPNQKHQQHFETVIQGLEKPENDFLQKIWSQMCHQVRRSCCQQAVIHTVHESCHV